MYSHKNSYLFSWAQIDSYLSTYILFSVENFFVYYFIILWDLRPSVIPSYVVVITYTVIILVTGYREIVQ